MDELLSAFLTKGIEFLWNEASSLLNRIGGSKSPPASVGDLPSLGAGDSPSQQEGRDSVLARPLQRHILVEEARMLEEEIKHVLKLVRTHRKSLSIYSDTRAKMGMMTPPHIIHGIEDEKQNLKNRGQRLKELLERAYGESIQFSFDVD